MKISTKIIILALLGFTGLIGFLPFKECHRQWQLYRFGASLLPKHGDKKISHDIKTLVQEALTSMKVKKAFFMNIYETNHICGAATYHMWINPQTPLGPLKFVIFHESAHIALNHFYDRFFADYNFSPQHIKAQEVEADLLACQTLFELGMQDVIIERIQEIKQAIQQKRSVTNSTDHPSLEEMYTYLCEFLKSKGIMV